MKTEERALPDLVRATRDTARQRRPKTDEQVVELGEEWVEEIDSGEITSPAEAGSGGSAMTAASGSGDDSGPSDADQTGRRPTKALKTAEINVERDRRPTLTSPIPAIMAESMRGQSAADADVDVTIDVTAPRDPAAPEPERPELTRRLGDSEPEHVGRDASAGYTVEVVNDPNAEHRHRAARLIDRARAAFDVGDLPAAALAADEALYEAAQAPPPGIVEVIEPARPLLARIFAAFVGPLSEVPVLARRSQEIAGLSLDDRQRAVVSLVDGVRTLDDIFDLARIPPPDALRIAASLMRAGVIRVV
jgi:hypothetical protein